MGIGIIGAGRVGVSFGRLLYEKNLLTGFFSDVYPDFDFPVFESCEKLCKNSDIIFITVPDGKIATVWDEIKDYCNGKIVCHMSGAMSAEEVFTTCKMRASLHPMMAVSSVDATDELKTAAFTVEGTASKEIKELLNFFNIREIDSDKKALYHASCVFASNLMQGIIQISVDNLVKCGFNKSEALIALERLAVTNMENIFKKGIQESLTGPVDRGDAGTVKKHLNILSGDEKEIYRLLSQKLTQIAEEKYNADYSELRKELN